MNRRITKLLEISVFNTIKMNFHYFGWGGYCVLGFWRLKT